MINLAMWQQHRVGILLKIFYNLLLTLCIALVLGCTLAYMAVWLKKRSLNLELHAVQTKIRLLHEKYDRLNHDDYQKSFKNCLTILNRLSDLPEEVFLEQIIFNQKKIIFNGVTVDELLLRHFFNDMQCKTSDLHWQYSTINTGSLQGKKFTAQLSWYGG